MSRLRPFLRGLLRAVRLAPRELLTMFRVGVVLVVVELLIRWVPLPRLGALLGVGLDLAPPVVGVGQMAVSELPPVARRQLRCTRRVADIWPFSKGPCLRRSLVAGHLLRHHGAAVRLGVAGAGDDVHAHAWLEIAGRPLETVSAFAAFHHAPTGLAR